MEATPSAKAEHSEQDSIRRMCEWKPCKEKAKWLEPYKGDLHNLCTPHRRLIRAQKRADNNQ